jgi:TonB family protein
VSNYSNAWHPRFHRRILNMFDKLIVSEPDRGEMKHRRNYFLVSTVVVGTLFITGVVISIFAADFSLGASSFELTELIAPLDMAAPETAQPRPQLPNTPSRSQSDLPMRQDNIQNIMEMPKVPDSISTARNTTPARPVGSRFDIGPVNSDPVSTGIGGRETNGEQSGSGGHGIGPVQPKAIEESAPPPARVDPPKPKKTVTKGVVNGMAKNLPKPEYSAAARAVNAQGKVDVQVTIDESGHVISANAVSGHPLLRSAAESAARRASFSTTYLSDTPVRVTGVIVYNFIR